MSTILAFTLRNDCCCPLTIQYVICIVYVGLYEHSEQLYLGAKHLDKYGASLIYISYGPP